MSNVISDPERWESVEADDDAPIERRLVAEGEYCVPAGFSASIWRRTSSMKGSRHET